MIRKTMSLAILTVLGAIVGLTSTVKASETATIWNNSNHTVAFYLKWNTNPLESPIFLLPPGNHVTTSGPDGATLSIRYISTPTNNLAPKELRGQVATGFTAGPLERGMHSCFLNVSPFDVNLFVLDLGTTQGLQIALITLGYNPGPVDGFYGLQTISAVRAFQVANGLFVDGNAGDQTRTALRTALNAKP
jgi:hypothetical protein